MGEEITRRKRPPGRWLASDGQWYEPTTAPDQLLWVVVDSPAPLACHPGLANLGVVYGWNPSIGGLQCTRCRAASSGEVADTVRPDAPKRMLGGDLAGVRRILLKREDRCATCQMIVPVRTRAGWDANKRVVICEPCLDGRHSSDERQLDTFIPTGGSDDPDTRRPIDCGVAGRSAWTEFERRSSRFIHDVDGVWGPGSSAGLSPDRDAIAFRRGAEGEVLTGRALDEIVSGRGCVLHDRAVPGTAGNIDHLAIVSSGVWVIDSKNYRGKVKRARRSGAQSRLLIRGIDRQELVDGLGWQVSAVDTALGGKRAPILRMLVFPTSSLGWWRNSFEIGHTSCSQLAGIRTALWSRASTLDPDEIESVSRLLSEALPPMHP